MQRKLMVLLLVMTSNAFAQTSAPLSEDDPAVWAAREARAKHLREESSRMRRVADDERAKADAACRKRFFENACKDSARERWIEKINKVRALEIEAVGLERNQRAHEIAMRDKARSSAPSRPPLILPEAGSAPQAAPKPGGSPLTPAKGRDAPKPQGQPLDASQRAAQQAGAQKNREENAQHAAARAAQARKDAARYETQAKEHARKQAERKAGKPASAPLAVPTQ